MSRTPTMHEQGKSDGCMVPEKLPNEAEKKVEEAVEGKRPAEGNTHQRNAPRTQCREQGAPSELERVRQIAKKDKNAKFTALLHHVTKERLERAYQQTSREAAPGVDGVTWEQYGRNLEQNLQELHARLQRGAYRARPSRRVYIPKPDGRQRPLGIAALEDKIVQRAVVEVLNAIYEVDFAGFSYGFRPKRSQHQALDALAVAITRKRVNWVLDADIRGFFDAVNHEWLVKFIEHRIADRRVVRLIQKWLAAGILEDGKWKASEGTPQGGTASPLLANVYLHYVFDLWVQQWRKRQARGDVVVVRYADDVIVGFQDEQEARRFQEELGKRMQSFALELHPDKTKLVRFGRFAQTGRAKAGRAGTFNFLGFTHISGKTRRGRFMLVRRTIAKRMQAKLKQIRLELRKRMHEPVPEQGKWLRSVVGGYFAYHAVPTNSVRLGRFRMAVIRAWAHTLKRRSQVSRITRQRIDTLAARWIPPTRVRHPWPLERFDARTRGRSPVR